ncbi:MAG: PIG-L family deacetylase [Actinomycetota bacterium]|nr:PIG-L family deacetylase [Actinomycetota bacterium]
MEFARALVVYAHPDDAEFVCGGTVAAWTGAGTEVFYLCVTDGSAGWNGPGRTREEVARLRIPEQQAAGEVLGVSEIRFLGYGDGSLAASLDVRRDIAREVRRLRPDVIATFDPSQLWSGRSYVNHPDHRAVGEATLAVVACDAPTRLQFPELLDEGLEPFDVPALWLACDTEAADRFVDISDTFDLKVKAMQCHRSQLENMRIDDIAERMRRWATEAGRPGGVELAEAFRTFAFGEEG